MYAVYGVCAALHWKWLYHLVAESGYGMAEGLRVGVRVCVWVCGVSVGVRALSVGVV